MDPELIGSGSRRFRSPGPGCGTSAKDSGPATGLRPDATSPFAGTCAPPRAGVGAQGVGGGSDRPTSQAGRIDPIMDDASSPPLVLVVDFPARRYAQLIARRVREARWVYSEIVPHTWTAAQILEQRKPAAVILPAAGPFLGVLPRARPTSAPSCSRSGIPTFYGMCYGFQAMARALGGVV